MEPMSDDMATWINTQREHKKWSIREFGRRIGVSHTHAARLANGDIEPDADMCISIARAFDKLPSEVLIMAGHLEPAPKIDVNANQLLHIWSEIDDDARQELMSYARYLYETRTKDSEPTK